MLTRDILNLKGGTIYTVDASAPLESVVSLMVNHDIGSLVVTENARMTGMLTFREVLQSIDRNHGLGDVRARDVMITDPICGNPTDTIDELRELMTRHHVRYLPVREGEKLLGIVSFHDVAKAVITETSMENRLRKRYIAS